MKLSRYWPLNILTRNNLTFPPGSLLRVGVIIWLLVAVMLLGNTIRLIVFQSISGTAQAGILTTAIIPFSFIALLALVFALNLQGDYAPIIILAVALFSPFSLPTGTESRLVDGILVTVVFIGVWIIRIIIDRDRFAIKPSPINVPIIGFIGVTILAWIWSILARDSWLYVWDTFPLVQFASTIVMVLLPASMLLVSNVVERQRTMIWMTALFLVAGVLALIDFFFHIGIPINSAGLFFMWVVCLATGMALFNDQLNPILRGLLFVLAGSWLYIGIGINIQWLAGWLPSLIGFGILVFIRSRKLFVLTLIVFLIIVAMNFDHFSSFFQAETEESLLTRLSAWGISWEILKHHLLLGTGPGGYAVYYVNYFPTRAMATHSNYIDIVAQIGVIGGLFLLGIIVALFVVSYRVIRKISRRRDFMGGLAMACFAGFIGVLVIMGLGDWLFPFAYTQTIAGFDYAIYSWLFIGLIPAIDHLKNRAPDQEIEE